MDKELSNKKKFAIFYAEGVFVQIEGEHRLERIGHSIVVEAENKVDAFVSGYHTLVAKGHMVCTAGPFEGMKVVTADGQATTHSGMAGLTATEMQEVYSRGVPIVGPGSNFILTHIDQVKELAASAAPNPPSEPKRVIEPVLSFVDEKRISELEQCRSDDFDLTKLDEFCRELNINYSQGAYLAVAMLVRGLLDHVSPILGFRTFAEVANNYACPKSFKESMLHLELSSRKIADAHLHTTIRKQEILPTQTQINFSNDLDVLLGEIIRIMKKVGSA